MCRNYACPGRLAQVAGKRKACEAFTAGADSFLHSLIRNPNSADFFFGCLGPALQRPGADPLLKECKIALPFFLRCPQIFMHIAGLSVCSAGSVVKPPHKRARVRPAGKRDHMAAGVHAYAFALRGPGAAVFFKQAILRRSTLAVAARALALKQRLYVLSVGYFFTQAR